MIDVIVNSLTLASIYFLFAVGMSLVWGSIGVLNFAHGGIFMASAFGCFLILDEVALPLLGVMAVGMVIGGVLAALVQFVAFGPILTRERDRHAGEFQIIAAGIGLASVIVALAQKRFNEPFGLSASTFEIRAFRIGELVVTNIALIIIGLAVLLGTGLTLWLRRSIQGTALRSIGVDPTTASLMGINRPRMALLAMVTSGVLAGLAGSLLTLYLGAIETTSGDALIIKAFAIIVLGGVGSVAGAVVGSVVLALAETLLLTYSSGTWVDAASFGLIFVILLVRPRGIFGRKEVRRT